MNNGKAIEFQRVSDWLDGILKRFKLNAKAFNINIYENENNYSLELVATASFDPNNDDWACDEIYASRDDDDNEYYFNAKNFEAALEFAKNALNYYFENGKYAEKFKNACAVAYGFVDGDLNVLHTK